MSNYNIKTLILTEWYGMGCCMYQPTLCCRNKDLKIKEAYKNTGLFFANTTRPHGFAPCRLYSKTQAEGQPPVWTVPAVFQKEKRDGRAKGGS